MFPLLSLSVANLAWTEYPITASRPRDQLVTSHYYGIRSRRLREWKYSRRREEHGGSRTGQENRQENQAARSKDQCNSRGALICRTKTRRRLEVHSLSLGRFAYQLGHVFNALLTSWTTTKSHFFPRQLALWCLRNGRCMIHAYSTCKQTASSSPTGTWHLWVLLPSSSKSFKNCLHSLWYGAIMSLVLGWLKPV